MRQLTLLEPKKVEWQEVPEPVIEDGRQALVRPIAVALCDADQPAILGESPAAVPVALGHEFVAEVAEVGEDVGTVSVGDRVIVPFQISCGHCVRCAGGQTGDCTTVDRLSMYGFGGLGGPWGGALSDLVRVPFADAMLLPLPEGRRAGHRGERERQHPRRLADRGRTARANAAGARCSWWAAAPARSRSMPCRSR